MCTFQEQKAVQGGEPHIRGPPLPAVLLLRGQAVQGGVRADGQCREHPDLWQGQAHAEEGQVHLARHPGDGQHDRLGGPDQVKPI